MEPRHRVGPVRLFGTGTSEAINWPSCGRCRRVVDAYGIDEETDAAVHVWVRHHGERDGIVLMKGPFWTPSQLGLELGGMTFFMPKAEGAEHRILRGDPKRGAVWTRPGSLYLPR
jgi:hypothetical protein